MCVYVSFSKRVLCLIMHTHSDAGCMYTDAFQAGAVSKDRHMLHDQQAPA